MLILNIVKGHLNVNTEEFTMMDPFILVTCNGKKFQTNTCEEGGQDPVWNQTLSIPILNTQRDKIHIECLEEDITSDDYIGSADIAIKKYASPKN